MVSSTLPEANRAGGPGRCLVWNRPRNSCYSQQNSRYEFCCEQDRESSILPEAQRSSGSATT